MNANQLEEIISNFSSIKNNFLGIYSIDTLPKTFPINHFLVCNYDLKTSPGSHWFALIRKTKEKIECFDSLSLNESKKKLLLSYCLFRNAQKIVFNQSSVQKTDTATCGKFVTYFLIHRMHNLDQGFQSVLNEIFVTEPEQNELEVEKFLSNIV